MCLAKEATAGRQKLAVVIGCPMRPPPPSHAARWGRGWARGVRSIPDDARATSDAYPLINDRETLGDC